MVSGSTYSNSPNASLRSSSCYSPYLVPGTRYLVPRTWYRVPYTGHSSSSSQTTRELPSRVLESRFAMVCYVRGGHTKGGVYCTVGVYACAVDSPLALRSNSCIRLTRYLVPGMKYKALRSGGGFRLPIRSLTSKIENKMRMKRTEGSRIWVQTDD